MQVATLYYRLERMNAFVTIDNIDIWFFTYIFFAPLLFTLPLTFFTSKLSNTKEEAIKKLNKMADTNFPTDDCLTYEKYLEAKDLQEVYLKIKSIKIWPIDIISITKLIFSSLLPVLPILMDLLGLSLPSWIFEMFY